MVNIVDVCEGPVYDRLADPASCVLGKKDKAADGEWEPLARALVERGILVPAEQVIKFKGEMILNGLLGVEKANKPLPSGVPSQRLIMDLRASNAVLSVIPGDISTLSGASEFTSITLEDVSSFYLFS